MRKSGFRAARASSSNTQTRRDTSAIHRRYIYSLLFIGIHFIQPYARYSACSGPKWPCCLSLSQQLKPERLNVSRKVFYFLSKRSEIS